MHRAVSIFLKWQILLKTSDVIEKCYFYKNIISNLHRFAQSSQNCGFTIIDNRIEPVRDYLQ